MSATVTLHADPSASAQQLKFAPGPGGATQRIVELLDAREGWSFVRTVVPRQAVALGYDASMGLAILELEGWVPAAQLLALEPSAAAPAPLPMGEFKSGVYATIKLVPQANVAAGVILRWPDGRVAGRVAEAHHFFTPATTRSNAAADTGPVELACHEHRSAPGLGVIQGWLCSEPGELIATGATTGVPLDRPPTSDAGGPGTELKGALDRDIISRIVRSHLGDVRNCYNQGLAVDPKLQGRVAINFVITGDGTVGSAVVQDDNLSDAAVGRCIAAAVTTWRFPKPRGGGNVIVTYPFNLTPG
ncbi:AgmX/PglI C-terminal domain-containing protein [Enhygromyxa salina]|uniref:AgmX/PglI C-terminal domain-containing protein n=1 Tax=Enhygromyxa salina TaxID=215803 RepID=UPI001FD1F8D1|nr:AgmX/PglI C-terminal domain-containing protein [Enhygromyxa salina]